MTSYFNRRLNPRYFADATPRAQTPALSPNERLCGAEADSRANFEQCIAKGWPEAGTHSCVRLGAGPIVILVNYSADQAWSYEYEGRGAGVGYFGLHGSFESRSACLDALAARAEVQA